MSKVLSHKQVDELNVHYAIKVDGVQVIAAQQADYGLLDITFTANAPTAGLTATVADGAAPSVVETGQFMANVESQLANIRATLQAHGLMA